MTQTKKQKTEPLKFKAEHMSVMLSPNREVYYRDTDGSYLVKCKDNMSIHFRIADLTVSVPEKNDFKLHSRILGHDFYSDIIVDTSGRLWFGYEGEDLTLQSSLHDVECYFNEEHDVIINEVRAAMGRKPKMPAWAFEAIANGFTPPSTFKVEDYE